MSMETIHRGGETGARKWKYQREWLMFSHNDCERVSYKVVFFLCAKCALCSGSNAAYHGNKPSEIHFNALSFSVAPSAS